MQTRETELEDFKTLIDLEAYAEAQGYVSDTRVRSRVSRTMKHPDGDKIIIGMAAHDRHWIFCSIGDLTDNGSIIDFVQNRRGFNLGQVRKELRPWLDRPTAPLAEDRPRLQAAVVDLPGVRAVYEAAEPVAGRHPYLTDARAVPAPLLASERFAGMMRSGADGSVLFPHWNLERKVCGFEKKNTGFTGFAKGGQKGVWGSRRREGDRRLVIAETAIDALSHAALFPREDTRYCSIGGAMNPLQPGILHQLIRQLPEEGEVVAAVDHDDGGRSIAETLEAVFESVVAALSRGDLRFTRHCPDTEGQDWNDVLQAGVTPPPLPAPGPV